MLMSGYAYKYLFSFDRNVGKVHDEWFADEDKVRRVVGLLEKPVVKFPNGEEVSSQFPIQNFRVSALH